MIGPAETSAALAGQIRTKLFATAPGFDVLLTFDPDHVGYLSGYRSMSHDMGRHYSVAAVATPERIAVVLGAGDGPPALEVLGDPECLHRYGTFHVSVTEGVGLGRCRPAVPGFADALQAALGELVRPGDVVGIDHTGHAWRAVGLEELLRTHRRTAAQDALLATRATKLPGEVARIRRAAALLEEGLSAAFGAARAGVCERDLAAVIAGRVVAGGGVPRALAVTSGPRAALVDAFPSGRKLVAGDTLRIDLGCTYDGYWADMARTAFVGEPSAARLQRFAAISAGLAAERASLVPGCRAGELFDVALATTREAGIPEYRRQHCGHGIGVESHEYPHLAPGSMAEIRAGMVLCIETPFYEQGWGGMMTEEMLHVTSDGIEPITSMSAELRVLG